MVVEPIDAVVAVAAVLRARGPRQVARRAVPQRKLLVRGQPLELRFGGPARDDAGIARGGGSEADVLGQRER